MVGGVDTSQVAQNGAAELYLDLLKGCLTRELIPERYRPLRSTGWKGLSVRLPQRALASMNLELVGQVDVDPRVRAEGRDWPTEAETMIGRRRLDNLQHCITEVVAQDVPGDLIETGVWRGGSVIFMRAVLKSQGVRDRTVWVADSFQGLPRPDVGQYPKDQGDTLWRHPALAISLSEVKSNFSRYGLLDNQVRFLVGWFKDTLSSASIDSLAVLRLDGDLYESTLDALAALYPKLSVGGYVIIDDFESMPPCKAAVQEYRAANHISEKIKPIDGNGVFWRREG